MLEEKKKKRALCVGKFREENHPSQPSRRDPEAGKLRQKITSGNQKIKRERDNERQMEMVLPGGRCNLLYNG